MLENREFNDEVYETPQNCYQVLVDNDEFEIFKNSSSDN